MLAILKIMEWIKNSGVSKPPEFCKKNDIDNLNSRMEQKLHNRFDKFWE